MQLADNGDLDRETVVDHVARKWSIPRDEARRMVESQLARGEVDRGNGIETDGGHEYPTLDGKEVAKVIEIDETQFLGTVEHVETGKMIHGQTTDLRTALRLLYLMCQPQDRNGRGLGGEGS